MRTFHQYRRRMQIELLRAGAGAAPADAASGHHSGMRLEFLRLPRLRGW